MIAAGSLFTSCVTNTEPQGIKDMREAKADYIASLSKLKQAEIEKMKAEAAYKDAETAYKNAETALKEAEVKAKEIENAKADAAAQAAIEKTLADAQLAAVKAAEKLAKAEFEFQQTLNNLAVLGQKLTPVEEKAIKDYTRAYEKYLKAEQAVRNAESKVYYTDLRYAEFVQQLKIDTAEAAATIAVNQMLLENLPDSGASEAEIKALLAMYDQERVNAEYTLANIDAEWNLYRQTKVAEDIKGFAAELSEWVVKNAALPAPYAVHYKADLPDNDQVNKLFAKYFDVVDTCGQATSTPCESVEISPENYAIAANFYSIPSAIKHIKALDTVISALSRELVVDSTKYAGRIDTAGLAKAVAAANKEYEEIAKALTDVGGVEAYQPVKDAWKAFADTTISEIDAKDSVYNAYRDFYDNVYGKFWGVTLTISDIKDVPVSRKVGNDTVDAVILNFRDPANDSLEVNFTKATFTKERVCAEFITSNNLTWFEDSAFVENVFDTTKIQLINNSEVNIVWDELSANQRGKLATKNIAFKQTLLARLLCKEQKANNYSIGAEGTTKALARLQEIKDELVLTAIGAVMEQVAASQPFFEFVDSLFGKQCIDAFCARLDSAAAVAAQFMETKTDPEEDFIRQLLSSPNYSSKALFVVAFEKFMCGSFDKDSKYRTAYEHMQIAKAFSGEEFADLVSAVIAAFIESSPLEEVLKVNIGDNILEKILFGTSEKVAWKDFFDGTDINLAELSFRIVAPVVGPFLTGNFGGKIADLQKKYFTEWANEWASYDEKRAAVNATLNEIKTEVDILFGYAYDVREIIFRANVYEYKIAVAMAEYEDARQTLEAIAAGADRVVLWKEKVADKLAVANANLAAAADKLAAAEAAYRQVLANHESVDTPTE